MPQSPTETHDDVLRERYGRRSKPIPRWALIAAGVIALVGTIAFFVWIGAHQMRPTATYEEVNHSIVSDTEATITFNVRKPAAESASCVVVAENKAYAQVGWKEIEITPASADLVQVTTSIATSERATIVKMASCELIN